MYYNVRYSKFKIEVFEDLLRNIKDSSEFQSDYLFYLLEVLFIMLTEGIQKLRTINPGRTQKYSKGV